MHGAFLLAMTLATTRLGVVRWQGWDRIAAILSTLGHHRSLGIAAEMSFWLFCAMIPLAVTAVLISAHLPFKGMSIGSPWWKKRVRALLGCLLLSFGGALLALLGAGWNRLSALVPVLTSRRLGLPLRSIGAVAVLYGLVAGLYRLGIPKLARITAGVARIRYSERIRHIHYTALHHNKAVSHRRS